MVGLVPSYTLPPLFLILRVLLGMKVQENHDFTCAQPFLMTIFCPLFLGQPVVLPYRAYPQPMVSLRLGRTWLSAFLSKCECLPYST